MLLTPGLLILNACALSAGGMSGEPNLIQHAFEAPSPCPIELASEWDVLGPFPIHAREQHFISPSFPLELTVPYEHDISKSWPSSLDGTGFVNWTKVQAEHGTVRVTYPNVRWDTLRATEGWAALQHHSLLHTTLKVSPSVGCKHAALRLNFQLTQGSYLTIIPRRKPSSSFVPKWHAGNVYAMHRSTPISFDMQNLISGNESTEFDVFVSGDYEIRLFGDPRDQGSEIPTLVVNLQVGLEEVTKEVEGQNSLDVACDFVDGYALGDALGFGLRSVEGWWKLSRLTIDQRLTEVFDLELLQLQVFAPSQSRIVPVRLRQLQRFSESTISFNAVLSPYAYDSRDFVGNEESSREVVIPVILKIRHHAMWSESQWEPLLASFFFAESHPTRILVKPPKKASEGISTPILALHGAGVDIMDAPFWADAIPRQQRSWIIMPAGRTEWGLDWHGVSAAEAWAAVPAFSRILSGNEAWKGYAYREDSKPLVAGHSNGGQGAWYLASRFPDQVVAVLPAAGYLNPTAYVPLTQSHGARYADPALRAILESSYATDDNALFMSNLANKPVLVVHGGNDTNVPTWHSREYTSLVSSWATGEDISLRIDSGKPHWYAEVFRSEEVEHFLRYQLESAGLVDSVDVEQSDFTLTIADPMRSGSLFGWKIEKVLVPGRLARLNVRASGTLLVVKTSNVAMFSTSDNRLSNSALSIDTLAVPMVKQKENQTRRFRYENSWVESPDLSLLKSTPAGRMQNIFDSLGPLQIVIPPGRRSLNIALRITHMLDTYLKLDAEIIVTADSTAPPFGLGNLIFIGKETFLLEQVLGSSPRLEFSIRDGEWYLRGRPISSYASGESVGLLFTHPHPSNPRGLSLMVDGSDELAFERMLRLAAPRTGIAVPDWIIVDEKADSRGIGGVVGAGVWTSDWEWNEAMSWLSC